MSAADPTTVAASSGGERTSDPPRTWTFPAGAVFLGCLFLAGFLVRLWPIWKVHFWDEAVYLQNAEFICCGKTNYSELSSRPPLLSLIFAGVFRVWHHVYAASIVTAVMNAVGPVFLFLAGRKLVGQSAAAIAGLLLAFSPFFVSGNVGNSLLTDSPALSLILVSLWLAGDARERSGAVWPAGAGFVGALAFLMRFASAPTVAIISLLMFRAKRWPRAIVLFGAGFAAGVAPYLLWSRLRYGGFLTTLQTGWQYVSGSIEPASYYVTHFLEVFPAVTLLGLVLWVVWLALERRAGGKATSLAASGFLWLWALADLVYFSSIAHKEPRYVLPLAPAVFLLSGQGLAVLLRGMDRRARAIGIAVLALLLFYAFLPTLQRFRGPLVAPFISEEKDVSDFLAAKIQPGATLYTNFNTPVFAYYTSNPIHRIEEIDASFYRVFPNNMPNDGYFIFYKNVDRDPRQDWLESRPDFQVFQDFPSITVYEYRAGGK